MDMVRTVSTSKRSVGGGTRGGETGVEALSSGFASEEQRPQPVESDDAMDDGVIATTTTTTADDSSPMAPSSSTASGSSSSSTAARVPPAKIPPEPLTSSEICPDEDDDHRRADVEDDDEDEEEDEYEYEDDDDAPFVSGFLVDNPAIAASRSAAEDDEPSGAAVAAPATIRDDDESVNGAPSQATAPTTLEVSSKPKWREPSREAVNMSLRAEKETSGGKRRLAQDLYRIMNQDTVEAGFSLQPSFEDSMDKWSIRLFKFDRDSNLAKDMLVLGLDHIELEMTFPDQYPFEPPFVRVVRPRFKRQTGFVMNGALCMELLTKDGWNPINDIESVIVSVRSLLVVGDGRLEAAYNLSDTKYNALLEASRGKREADPDGDEDAQRRTADDSGDEGEGRDEGEDSKHDDPKAKRQRKNSDGEHVQKTDRDTAEQQRRIVRDSGGSYSVGEAQAAYSHLSDYHKKKGWDSSGWWKRKG